MPFTENKRNIKNYEERILFKGEKQELDAFIICTIWENRVNGNNTNNPVNNDYENEITWGMKGRG